jgi:hypothetical protein
MRLARWLCKGLIALFCVCASAYSSAVPDGETLLQKAAQLELHDDQKWLKLLFYYQGWSGPKSLVDDPAFFLSPRGGSDPRAELEATIRFFWRVARDAGEPPPYCRFPARYLWLGKALGLDVSADQFKSCPALHQYLQQASAAGISLVFSSYYLENSSSMMGHTLLRLHRSGADGAKSSSLLDWAINYAADMVPMNPLLHALAGVAGGFRGAFMIMPYYTKIQEYENAESRDLWEYELNLRENQVSEILWSFWEVAPHRIDYYFFDDNCGLVLLYLLHIPLDGINLGDEYRSFVLPVSTIHTLMKHDGLVKEVHFRPSSRSQYEERLSRLAREEKKEFERLFARQEPAAVTPHAAQSAGLSKNTLDAALAYIKYGEKLHHDSEAVRFKEVYPQLLAQRSKIAEPPEPLTAVPTAERPDLGHPTMRYGLSIGNNAETGDYASLELRPALKDFATPPLGFPRELNIQMGRTVLRYQSPTGRLMLDSFHLFELFALSSSTPYFPSLAKQLSLGLTRREEHTTYQLTLQGGMGASGLFCRERLTLYALIATEVGIARLTGDGLAAGLGPRAGLAYDLNPMTRVTSSHAAFYDPRRDEDHFLHTRHEVTLSHSFSPEFEGRIGLRWDQGVLEGSATVFFYD